MDAISKVFWQNHKIIHENFNRNDPIWGFFSLTEFSVIEILS